MGDETEFSLFGCERLGYDVAGNDCGTVTLVVLSDCGPPVSSAELEMTPNHRTACAVPLKNFLSW